MYKYVIYPLRLLYSRGETFSFKDSNLTRLKKKNLTQIKETLKLSFLVFLD